MKLLKAHEAAARLGVSLSTLYALSSKGLLTPIRCGVSKGFRWSEESLTAFLAERKEPSTPGTEQESPFAPRARGIKLKHLRLPS